MIRSILIMDSNGQVIIDRTYEETHSVERNLIGSFLLAIAQFGQEALSDQVQEVIFSKMLIHFKRNDHFIIVGIADLDGDRSEIKLLINGISEEIIRRHKEFQSNNKRSLQRKINSVEQLIDHYILPYRNFEEKITKFWDQKHISITQTSLEELFAALNKKQKRIKDLKDS